MKNNKKENKKHVSYIPILVTILVLAIIALCVINIFFIHNQNFWELSISQALTLIVAVLIAFWATQKKTDERRTRDHAIKLTEKIQLIASNPELLNIKPDMTSDEVKRITGMQTRKLKNTVQVLSDYGKRFGFQEDVGYIVNQVREYNDFISEKVGDVDYLSKSETILRKYVENIDTKCDYIIMHLNR